MIGTFKFVVMVLLVLIGIAASTRRLPSVKGHISFTLIPWRVIASLAVILAVLVIAPSMGVVTAGERGVVLRFGAETGRILNEGLFVVTPLLDQVEIMSVQVHAHEAEADAASRDLQQVKTRVTLNYALDPAKVGEVYRTLRRDYVQRIIVPAIQESVKGATAQFEAEKLIGQRELVKAQIEKSLETRLSKYGIIVNAVSITDFAFSESFNQAIEAKAAAVQQAAKAGRDLERVKMEAQQKIAQAQAEAEALRIQKANVTPELLKLRQIEVQKTAIDKWNGTLPTVVSGGDIPFIMNLNR